MFGNLGPPAVQWQPSDPSAWAISWAVKACLNFWAQVGSSDSLWGQRPLLLWGPIAIACTSQSLVRLLGAVPACPWSSTVCLHEADFSCCSRCLEGTAPSPLWKKPFTSLLVTLASSPSSGSPLGKFCFPGGISDQLFLGALGSSPLGWEGEPFPGTCLQLWLQLQLPLWSWQVTFLLWD